MDNNSNVNSMMTAVTLTTMNQHPSDAELTTTYFPRLLVDFHHWGRSNYVNPDHMVRRNEFLRARENYIRLMPQAMMNPDFLYAMFFERVISPARLRKYVFKLIPALCLRDEGIQVLPEKKQAFLKNFHEAADAYRAYLLNPEDFQEPAEPLAAVQDCLNLLRVEDAYPQRLGFKKK
jgi:hypothetical protein